MQTDTFYQNLSYRSCQRCSEMYEKTDVYPLILKCGHTICIKCCTNATENEGLWCKRCSAAAEVFREGVINHAYLQYCEELDDLNKFKRANDDKPTFYGLFEGLRAEINAAFKNSDYPEKVMYHRGLSVLREDTLRRWLDNLENFSNRITRCQSMSALKTCTENLYFRNDSIQNRWGRLRYGSRGADKLYKELKDFTMTKENVTLLSADGCEHVVRWGENFYSGQISVDYIKNLILLHAVWPVEKPVSEMENTFKHFSMKKFMPQSPLVYLAIGRERLFIKLTYPNEKRARQFLLLCARTRNAGYIGVKLNKVAGREARIECSHYLDENNKECTTNLFSELDFEEFETSKGVAKRGVVFATVDPNGNSGGFMICLNSTLIPVPLDNIIGSVYSRYSEITDLDELEDGWITDSGLVIPIPSDLE